MVKRAIGMTVVLIAIATLAWWSLYRDQTNPQVLEAASFQGLSIEERAQMIADGAVDGGAPGAVLYLRVGDESAIVTAGVTRKRGGTSISPDTPLRVASISKIYTAAVIVELSRRGLIDLDEPFSSYLPREVVDGLPNGDTATVRQLLNHTAGIPDYYDIRHYMFGDWTAPLTLERTLPVAKRQKAPFVPGESLEYSNMGYILAGAIAEDITGRSLAELIEEIIVGPLGLSSTYYGLHNPPGADLHGYGTELRPWADTFVFWEHSGPDAGIVASASDVADVLTALLSPDGDLNDLGTAMLEQPFGYTERYQRAQGFALRTTRSNVRLIGHTGDVFGYVSFAYALPSAEAVAVAHINCDCAALLTAMATNVVQSMASDPSDAK